MSPEEEDTIAKQLAGPGWYQAVGDILAQENDQHNVVPVTDWRYAWVQDTLRKLERTVPLLAREAELEPDWTERGTEDAPFPPPADYPLRPRPRASEGLKSFCQMLHERKSRKVPHIIPGPPYSLVIVEKPEASNAFSYGFGPDGGGGMVVYSGFLDDVLSKNSPQQEATPASEQSWWSVFLRALFYSPQARPQNPTPSPEQTSELAILLAHELSHLILSHHLESMSSTTVVVPALVSIVTDVIRVALFPITMLFGPFVNDAVAQVGNIGGLELAQISEMCTSKKQEVEADIVSARCVDLQQFLFICF